MDKLTKEIFKDAYGNEIIVGQFTEVPKGAVKGWHFLSEDSTLAYEPGIKVEKGTLLTMTREPALYKQGLPYSKYLIDALRYAPSSILSRVWIGGKRVKGSSRGAAQKQGILWVGDISNILHEFSCLYAEKALEVTGKTDKLLCNVIEAKRAWMRGEISDEQLADVQRTSGSVFNWGVSFNVAHIFARTVANGSFWNTTERNYKTEQNELLTKMVKEVMKNE